MRYVPFRDKLRAGTHKRLTVLYGPEQHLRDEARDAVRRATAYRDGDRVVVDAAVTPGRVWLEASTYPQLPESERLVEVLNAHTLDAASWARANEWLDARNIPQVRVVLDLDADELPDDEEAKRLVKRAACVQVRCSPLNDTDAVEWIRSYAPMLTGMQAWRVLQRTGTDLAARDAARAIALLAGDRLDVSDAVVDLLSTPQDVEGFAEALLAGDKPRACRLRHTVAGDEWLRVVGKLDSQVETARRLHETPKSDQVSAIADLSRVSGIPINLVREVAHVSAYYTDARARRASVALAVTDEALRAGREVGVAEALIAMF